MPESDNEIVVDDPTAPSEDSPAVATTRTVEVVVYVLLLALAMLLGFDNWRSGMGWAKDGPQSGYLPFYLCVILGGAALYGLAVAFLRRTDAARTFVNRDQLRRVMQVFVPTLLFCLAMQWLGLYVASFLLVAGFMAIIGRIALWKSLLTSFLFALIMFLTFEVAFDVIMPKGPLEAVFGYLGPANAMEALTLLLHGFAVLLTWKTLALMLVGLLLGIFVGVLPGLGGPNGVAILLPLTFTMDPTSAIVMLSCIYWGALFGGAITSILFNIPGEAWSVATTFDGYPMAQQGKAAEALTAAFTSSFIGSLVAVLLITFLAPRIASFALRFGPPEFFAVYLLTFCSFVGLGREEKHKTIISMALGLLLAAIGMDTVSGQLRMTFGWDPLLRGVNFLVAVIGLFGISEILLTMEERLALRGHSAAISLRVVLKVWKELPRYWVTLLRSSAIGCWLGITPGGAIAASFMGYNLAKRFSKDPATFGTGRIEGVFAPETAAHASGTAALLPMLALGIPGSGTAAILLGGLMVWGLNPGPLLFVEHKDFVWGLIASMYLGNVVGLVIVLTTVPIFASILRIPFAAVAPMILVSCAIGAYAIQNAMFDVWLMLLFGVVGYVFKKIGIPLAPFTLALVLGNRSEDAFRLSMIGAGGDMRVFWSNGLVGSITTLALVLLLWPLLGRIFASAGRLLRPVKA